MRVRLCQHGNMPKRSSKKKRPSSDPNSAAFAVMAQVTETSDDHPAEADKNPAAVALGRLGGKKGGPARAKSLSKKRRAEIARNAATARWSER
jgi:hypothetical protein